MTENRNRIVIFGRDVLVGYNGTPALQIPALQLDGSVIALIGHNGAGKSTFLKTLLGLLPPSKGELLARFSEGSQPLTPELHMAFCPETGAVFADITVEEYLKLWCRIKSSVGQLGHADNAAIIERLEVNPLLKRKGRELSKGQRQRVQTAAGFLSRPKLFLFDEPFDGLDVQRTHELMSVIRESDSTISYLISSHRMDIIERLADQVIVVENGIIRATGSPTEVSLALCKGIWIIECKKRTEEYVELIERHVERSLAYHVGDTIRVAVETEQSEEQLLQLHRQQGQNMRISSSSPSLTDAMSLHLKLVKGSISKKASS